MRDSDTAHLTHSALIYDSPAAYSGFLLPFICEGLEQGESVAVAAERPRIAMLRDALGVDADAVRFLPADEWYVRPVRTIGGWAQMLRASAVAWSPRRTPDQRGRLRRSTSIMGTVRVRAERLTRRLRRACALPVRPPAPAVNLHRRRPAHPPRAARPRLAPQRRLRRSRAPARRRWTSRCSRSRATRSSRSRSRTRSPGCAPTCATGRPARAGCRPTGWRSWCWRSARWPPTASGTAAPTANCGSG